LNWIWLVLIIVVVAFDVVTSNVLLSWLMVGFVAAWLAGFYVEFTYQVLIAVVLGIVFLGIGNSISEKYIRNRIKNEPILVDKIVGQVFTAEDRIERASQQKINGIYWAIVNDGETILPGESFRVVGIKENKLTVVKEENEVMEYIIGFAILALIILIVLLTSIKVVNTGYVFVLERFGQFYRVLQPGWHVIIPFADFVRRGYQ